MKGRCSLLVLMLALVMVVLSACPARDPARGDQPGPGHEPRMGGTLVLGIRTTVTNLDGTMNGSSLQNGVILHLAETLVVKDDDGNVVPHLATDWEVSADGLEWTFTLREGVRFHDGHAFNAEAVKKSFERLLNPDFNLDRRTRYAFITEIEAVDEYTVVFRSREPFGPLLPYFTYVATAIVSPSQAGLRRIDHMIGTGPFTVEKFVPGEETILVANRDYWGEGPYLDRLVVLEVPEDTTRINMLRTGEIDVDMEAAPHMLQQFANDPAFVVVSASSERGLSIDFNVSRPPFDDPRIRHAIRHAIDVSSIIQGVLFGQGTPLHGFPGSAPGVTGAYVIPEFQDYDPVKARALLADAGKAGGLQAKLVYGSPRYPRHTEILTAIQAQLAEVGIQLELQTQDWATYVASNRLTATEQTRDATSWAWSSVIGDIAINLDRLHTNSIPPSGGGVNVSFYSNPEYDRLLDLARRETNPAQRDDYLRRAQEIAFEDLAILPLLRYNISVVMRAGVHGLQLFANEEFSVRTAWKQRD